MEQSRVGQSVVEQVRVGWVRRGGTECGSVGLARGGEGWGRPAGSGEVGRGGCGRTWLSTWPWQLGASQHALCFLPSQLVQNFHVEHRGPPLGLINHTFLELDGPLNLTLTDRC